MIKNYKGCLAIGALLAVMFGALYMHYNFNFNATAAVVSATAETSSNTISFKTGDSIITTANVDVFRRAGRRRVGSQSEGARGVVIGGPQVSRNVTYWKVDFETGKDGYVDGVYLEAGGVPDAPTVNISLAPVTIDLGDSATLSWSSTNADTCEGTNFETNGDVSGSVSVSPSADATFGVVCINAGGDASDVATLVVNQPNTPPTSTECEMPSVTFDESDFDHVFDGIEITSPATLAGAEWNNTLIKNCYAHDINGDGILLRDVENVVITNCTFENIAGQAAVRGSATGGTKNVVLYKNIVRNVAQNGFNFGQRSVDGVNHENLHIVGNTITDTGLSSDSGLSHGLYIQAQDYDISYNTISGSRDGNGISVRSSGDVVCNNVSGNSTVDKPGIRYYSDHQTGPTETINFIGNTVTGQSIGIDMPTPVDRYDGASGYDHVVKTFVFRDNQLDDNLQPAYAAPEYGDSPFEVIAQ